MAGMTKAQAKAAAEKEVNGAAAAEAVGKKSGGKTGFAGHNRGTGAAAGTRPTAAEEKAAASKAKQEAADKLKADKQAAKDKAAADKVALTQKRKDDAQARKDKAAQDKADREAAKVQKAEEAEEARMLKSQEQAAKADRRADKPKKGLEAMTLAEVDGLNQRIVTRNFQTAQAALAAAAAALKVPKASLVRKDKDKDGVAVSIIQCACGNVKAYPTKPFAQTGEVKCPKCKGKIAYGTFAYQKAA